MSEKLCFIVGAGASKLAGFPTGDILVEQIADLLNLKWNNRHPANPSANDEFRAALNPIFKEYGDQKVHVAISQLRNSLEQGASIDRILDINSENELMVAIGKLAIVYSILKCEQFSTLNIPSDNIYNRIYFSHENNRWYKTLWQNIFFKYDKAQLIEKATNIKFIVFNYDRCIEHYLYNSFKNCFPDDNQAAYSFVANLEIIHPYGAISELPYDGQNHTSKSPLVNFGERTANGMFARLSQNIRLFTEGLEDDGKIAERIQTIVEESNKIIFLGFGFADMNMKILKPTCAPESRQARRIFATAYGISEYNRQAIIQEIKPLMRDGFDSFIEVDNTADCKKLLEDYSAGIAGL
ncbi:SIR2-like protein [Maritalea mobilis]|uniref:SIR2-like protein n=1 Tax=Maritalea mobilis TaxID=483324 RepID=A0A4R6VSH3_9HYPH|nr:SIR2 family protein [Maritalea mobilis]TDQ66992.1 SIR2-like protein [Maritalea mobilis]